MKKTLQYRIFIAGLIVLISSLHYLTGSSDSPIHDFYRLLFFIPIILAAFLFGFKGGVITSILVGLIYSPFLLLSAGTLGRRTVNELLDIVLYFAIGVIAGTLVEKKNMSLLQLDNELNRYVLLENYTNGILESIKNGVIAVNNDLLITAVNQGAREILGIGNECIGLDIIEIYPWENRVKIRIAKVLEENTVVETIETVGKKGAIDCFVRISLFPLNLEGARKGLVMILEDITEMKKLQKQLQRADKLAALGELSTGIAHEIRNPLGIIKAIEQTMKKELRMNPEAVSELDMIDEEVERANRVVKSLMEFGKPGRDEKILVSVNSVLEDVLVIINKYAQQHEVRMISDFSEVPEQWMDREQLKQAFVNIIFNAVQAMPGGGELTVTTRRQEEFVRIIFQDMGAGIPEENLEKIFNPFFTTKQEGTGLGLSIVHRIVEEHEGTIHVNSRLGEGTAIEIVLPAGKEVSI